MKRKSIVLLSTFFLLLIIGTLTINKVRSANLASVKDTLQSSRLSFAGRVKSPTTAGSSMVYIYTSGTTNLYSISTSNLKAGDSLTIGTGTYTVVDVVDADQFTVSPALASGDADDTDVIYYKARPQHVVTFTTATAIANGYFRILLPSAGTGNTDGNPDSSGWDFGTGTVSVAVGTTSAGGYTFVTGVATASGVTGCTSPSNFHCFEIHYSGTGNTNTTINISIGNTNGTSTPLAPAPSSSHVEGNSTYDSYTYQVIQYDSTNTAIDQTNGKVALTEPVRVTVTVDPTITFTIDGMAVGATACGSAIDVGTTTPVNAPLAVPFSSMSLNTFKNSAHSLTVSTNAANGYAVTAVENNQLSKDGLGVTKISDTNCDSACAHNSAGATWTTATNNGFGYGIQNVSATGVDNDNSYTGTPNFRQFASTADGENPVKIFYGSGVANAQQAYVCYRISVGATQAAGDYENQVTYTATATF